MTVPPIYSNQRESVYANYDAVDLASGTGYVTYNGYSSQTSAVLDYHLDSDLIYSDTVETQDSEVMASGVAEKIMDLDFDTSTLNLPRTINGTVMINATGAVKANSATNTNIYFIAYVRKWDGSTETDLGTATSKTYTVSSSNAWKSSNFTIPIPISNQGIKKGETIRITLELWGLQSFISTNNYAIGHSPYNLDGSAIDPSAQNSNYNSTIINIPYKIDL